MNRVAGKRSFEHFACLSSTRLVSTSSIQKPKSIDDIPGARALPVIGSLFDMLVHKGGISEGRLHLPQKRVRTYGKIYREIIGSLQTTIYLADPADAETVLRSELSYPTRFEDDGLFHYVWQKYNLSPGVFFLDGLEWYKHRSVLSKRMLVPRSIGQLTPELNRISSEFTERLRGLRVPQGSDKSSEVVDINNELFKWSIESVLFAIFEKRFGSIMNNPDPTVLEFIQSTVGFLDAVFPTAYLPPKFYDYYETKSFKKFSSCYAKMYELAQLFIVQRLREIENNEEISSKDDNSEVSLLQYLLLKGKLTEKDLLSSIIDLMFAGVDTTSNTMQWILYELAKNPDKQALVYDQITSVLPRHSEVSNSDLQKLPYVKAVVKETLRLHPVLIEIPRKLQKDLVLSNYNVPAGSSVSILSCVMGRDPELFDEAECFMPERWLRSNDDHTFHKFSSTPFGFGRRMCLGRRLAELEMYLLLVHVILNFHLEYPENKIMEATSRATVIPKEPVRVKFIDRNNLPLT